MLALIAATGWPAALADAQTAPVTLSVTPTISAKPASQVPLTVRVDGLDAVPRGSLLRVRGLPPTIALSQGYAIAPGSWAVPLTALPSLKMTLPRARLGRSKITIALVSFDGSMLAEAETVLVVAEDTPPPAPQETTQRNRTVPPASILSAGTRPPDPIAPSAPSAPPANPGGSMPPEQRERALRLLKHGDELMAQGGIAQARLLYERAAEAGLPQGAMALASTYDPDELERLGVRGLQPDRAEAVRWYERARQLGAPDATQRLRRLGSN